jgi:sugar-specific transcriptional regulator TrmB
MNIEVLKKLGFSDKFSTVYLTLLRLGPSSIRKLAEMTGLNRGVVYEALKWLQQRNLVTFYEKEAKQYFVVEDPDRLRGLVEDREQELEEMKDKLEYVIPELRSVHDKGGERPVARYYQEDEVREILEDILEACSENQEKLYRVYSTAGIREYVYRDFHDYSSIRITRGISVKVIACGEGGELRGLDERKWLQVCSTTPTYIIIYAGKTAYMSLNAKNELVGVVIENEGIYQTQKIIFDELWNKL